MKKILITIILWFFITCSIHSQSSTNWYVSNTNGNDLLDGTAPNVIGSETGPVKNLSNLFQRGLIQDGDIVNIEANSMNAYPVISSILPTSGTPMILEITQKITINTYGLGDVIIDMTNPQSGLKFTVDGTIKFTRTGSGRFLFKGSSSSGINLNSGEILLDNVSFYIQDPFLFQSPHSNVSSSPSTTWYVDLNNGNDNNNGLSEVPSSGNSGPLKSIFQVYKYIAPPYSELANDIFYIEACSNSGGAFDSYIDGPVFLENVTLIGKQTNGNTNSKVIFNLLNTDLHISNKMRTIFKWQDGTSQNNFQFLGSNNTGIVFETGCVELNAPAEIIAPFLIRRTPSYCSGNTKIPLVVYDNRVYHTIAIQGNPNQCWLKENLNTGTMIAGTQDQIDNDPIPIIEKYCFVNDEENCNKYGGLYQWAEALQYNGANNQTAATLPTIIQGICPPNWHIPSRGEYNVLDISVSGESNKLKSIGVGSLAGQGTNTSGFSALYAGTRALDGTFSPGPPPNLTFYWTIDQYEGSGSQAWSFGLGGNDNLIIPGHVPYKSEGLSIRCVQDQWDGQGHFFRIANIPTGIEEISLDKEIPKSYSLLQNYPNPFNPSTTITYELTKPENVRINIYDSVGRLIRELVNRDDNAGKHSVIWDGKDSNGKLVSSGNYFYQIISGSFIQAKKMIFLK